MHHSMRYPYSHKLHAKVPIFTKHNAKLKYFEINHKWQLLTAREIQQGFKKYVSFYILIKYMFYSLFNTSNVLFPHIISINSFYKYIK